MYASLVFAAVLALATQAPAEQPPTPTSVAAEVITVKGVVEQVDYEARTITLRDADGSTAVVRASEAVANLAKVRKGDHVLVRQVVPVAVPGAGSNVVLETAKPGEQSARVTVDTEEVTATVESLDHATRTVVLRGTDGKVRTIKVDPSVPIDDVRPDDSATLRITRAVAVAVEKPAS